MSRSVKRDASGGSRSRFMRMSCPRGRRRCFACSVRFGNADACRRRDDVDDMKFAALDLVGPTNDETRRCVDEYGCARMYYLWDDGFHWDDADQAWWDAHIYNWHEDDNDLRVPLIESARFR